MSKLVRLRKWLSCLNKFKCYLVDGIKIIIIVCVDES